MSTRYKSERKRLDCPARVLPKKMSRPGAKSLIAIPWILASSHLEINDTVRAPRKGPEQHLEASEPTYGTTTRFGA